MYKALKKIAKRYDLAIATFALAISAFCVFMTMGILSVLFEHGASSTFNVVVVSSLLVINMWAVYLNIARLSQVIKKRIGK
jgi:uncharacterized membrane protein (DUF373 family)